MTSNPFDLAEHDDYKDHDDDVKEKEEDLPDPSKIFVPSEQDDDVAP